MDFDELAEYRHEKSCEEWGRKFRAQRDTALANWVSSFRDNQPSKVVGDCFGSFNWSCIVQFDDGVKWLVRFAVPGQVMDPDGKAVREAATMRMIQEKTSIPVPTVHAWGLTKDNPLDLGPFIIMDYIEGKELGKLWQEPVFQGARKILKSTISDRDLSIIYRQMARFLLDLAKLEFERAGSLFIREDDTVGVDLAPLTLKMQEIEAHGGVKIGGCRSKTFSSATEYFEYVAEQDFQHLLEQVNSIDDASDGHAKYKFRQQLKAIIPRLVNKKHDRSPFRLVCDDMRLGNVLVNNESELKIVAIVDWEWSYTAPYQMFYSPPRWLLITKPIDWRGDHVDRYKANLDIFLHELEQEEAEEQPQQEASSEYEEEKLSVLMRQSMDDGKFWFHELMYSSFDGAKNTAWEAVCRLHPDLDEIAPVAQSSEDEFVKTKLEQRETYIAEWAKMQADLDREREEFEALIRKFAERDPEIAANARAKGIIT